MGAAVRLERVTRRYGARVALDGLSLEVPEGSIFGLLGPNGAGKTTTFAILCGFVRPSSGRVFLLGEPLSRLNRVRHRMAALPQDARFQPNRTLRDCLRFLGELSGLTPDDARREGDRLLEAFGLAEARDVPGRAVSHGMNKRFGLAQAFLMPADLLLLDEPTEGLDPRVAHEVRDRIRSASRRPTVVVSSHNLAEVQDLCDAAAILDRGRLVAQGTMRELTESDERVIVTLGPGSPDPSAAVGALPGVTAVERSPGGDRLRVTLRPRPGEPVEAAITAVLRALMDQGATIGAVTRGRTLEERFLELT